MTASSRREALVDRIVSLPVHNLAVGQKPYVILHALDRDRLADALADAAAIANGAEQALKIIAGLLERHGESLIGEAHVNMMNLRRALASQEPAA